MTKHNFDQASHCTAVTQPTSKALFDYWNALRNGRAAPLRSDVDPGSIRPILPHVFLLERLDPAHIIFRLAGTALCAAFGRELKDHNFVSLWELRDRTKIRLMLEQGIGACNVGVIRLQGLTLGRTTYAGESLLVPLFDSMGVPTRIMGCMRLATPRGPTLEKTLVRLRAETIAVVNPTQGRLLIAGGSGNVPELRPTLSLVRSPARPASPSLSRPWSAPIRDTLRRDD